MTAVEALPIESCLSTWAHRACELPRGHLCSHKNGDTHWVSGVSEPRISNGNTPVVKGVLLRHPQTNAAFRVVRVGPHAVVLLDEETFLLWLCNTTYSIEGLSWSLVPGRWRVASNPIAKTDGQPRHIEGPVWEELAWILDALPNLAVPLPPPEMRLDGQDEVTRLLLFARAMEVEGTGEANATDDIVAQYG